MSIWSDQLLDQLSADASFDINKQTNCLFHRFLLTTTAGTSVYTLPNKVRGVIRITWRGKKVWPLGWDELAIINPSTVFVDNSTKIETSQSTPQFYALHPTNVHDIRFYPTPNESFSNTGDPYAPSSGDAKCIISCWRHVDETAAASSLPTYIARRTVKAYVLWRAFEKEGKGQNLSAAAFYKNKYKFLIDKFIRINESCYVSKRYKLEDAVYSESHPAKPSLPSNYESVTLT